VSIIGSGRLGEVETVADNLGKSVCSLRGPSHALLAFCILAEFSCVFMGHCYHGFLR
jgi:hypothetical protein